MEFAKAWSSAKAPKEAPKHCRHSSVAAFSNHASYTTATRAKSYNSNLQAYEDLHDYPRSQQHQAVQEIALANAGLS